MKFDPKNCRNESEVESKLIVSYLLPALGYTPETWHQEVSFGKIRLDFLSFATQAIPLTLDANSPLALVMEAKHPKQNLNHHIRRLGKYLTSLNIRYGLLTNAKEIRIYEKINNQIKLVFNCQGDALENNIDQIKQLIGRDNLKAQLKDEIENVTNAEISPDKLPLNPGEIVLSQLNLAHPQTQPITPIKETKKTTMKTIAVYHNKGGVGKTTTVVNLAAALRNQGKRILVIDLDSQANTTFATGLIKFIFEEEDSIKSSYIYHVIASSELDFIPDVVRQSEFFNDPEIDIIPSHIQLLEHENTLRQFLRSRIRLISKLKQVENSYDIVIIDTPPARDIYAEIALMAADYLIIPSDLKPFANQGLRNLKEFIKQINESRDSVGRNPLNILGVLPSKISTNPQFRKYALQKQTDVIVERYQLPLMSTIIFERGALSKCLNKTIQIGELEIPNPESIFKYADSDASANDSAEEFEALAAEVLEKMELN